MTKHDEEREGMCYIKKVQVPRKDLNYSIWLNGCADCHYKAELYITIFISLRMG